ncbi:hypothetical protein ACEQ6A_11355 [Rhizobium brockwellii]|uniref:hypothetical protein n=1 Tax=Rhizobium brockwellii TaxID=3019932 RepID=UPI003F99880D
MSLNRKTKAYQKRVKRLAGRFHAPPFLNRRPMTIDEIWAYYEPGSPEYLFRDALSYLADDLQEAGDSFKEMADEYHSEADRFRGMLDARKKSHLKVIGGAP